MAGRSGWSALRRPASIATTPCRPARPHGRGVSQSPGRIAASAAGLDLDLCAASQSRREGMRTRRAVRQATRPRAAIALAPLRTVPASSRRRKPPPSPTSLRETLHHHLGCEAWLWHSLGRLSEAPGGGVLCRTTTPHPGRSRTTSIATTASSSQAMSAIASADALLVWADHRWEWSI